MKPNIQDQTNNLYNKLVEELPYDTDDNAVIAEAVKDFLLEHPDRIHDFLGTLIEDEEAELV